jgi:hypothetical protein
MSNEFDSFARSLLEEAKRFLEKCNESKDDQGRTAYLHAALVLGFSALEAHISAIADEFGARPEFEIAEKSLLLEKDIRFDDGEFKLSSKVKFFRLEDRISFLYRKFAGKQLEKTSGWWPDLAGAIDKRNSLVHPKSGHSIDDKAVSRALQAIINCINELYVTIYKTNYPPANRGLQSSMKF